MIIKIENSIDGRLQFVNNGCVLQVTFLKIERVSPYSNYYCLWRNHDDEFFYLYNVATGRFALRTNSFNQAHKFKKIEFYSETTKSFVAVRYDEPYSHILFEDGYLEERTFNDVGAEYNNSRPVMVRVDDGNSYKEKWAYYNCERRKLDWDVVHYGLTWKEEWGGIQLGRKLHSHYYEIVFQGGCWGLCSYIKKRGKYVYFDDKFESLNVVGNKYVVGKMFKRNLYVLFCTTRYCNNPIGYYTECPQYLEKHDLMIVRREENWCIIINNKELSNYQWRKNDFLFIGNYIFNKNMEDEYWKIFNRKDGSEVLLNWRHIRVFDEGASYILVDKEDKINQKVIIEDIERESKRFIQELIEKSKNLDVVSPPRNENEKPKKVAEPILKSDEIRLNNLEVKKVSKQETNIQNCPLPQDQVLPSRIDFYAMVDTLLINKDGLIPNNRKCNHLSVGNYVCWIVKDIKAIIISKYVRSKTYRAIYCKIVERETELFERKLPIHISPIDIEGISEDTLIDMIKEAMPIEKKCLPSVSTRLVESTTEKDNDIKHTKPIVDYDLYRGDVKGNASFVFNGKNYSLELNAAWPDGDIFYIRSFLLKKDSLAILLDDQTEIFKTPINGVNYKLTGEGKDKRFDQDFNRVNEAIRTNSRPIILFKKDSTGVLRFFDVAKCSGYTIEGETRKVIIFELCSLLRFKKDMGIYGNNTVASEFNNC